MAKLILDIEPRVIAELEKSAKKKEVSLSAYATDLLTQLNAMTIYETVLTEQSLSGKRKKKIIDKKPLSNEEFLEKLRQLPVSPAAKRLSGILKGTVSDNLNIKDLKYEYLKEKHGL